MDAAEALADLREISIQVEAAVIFDESGAVVGSTMASSAEAEETARLAAELMAGGEGLEAGEGKRLVQLQVDLGDASVFVLREAGQAIAAVTGPEPTSGLVFYDLRSCLRSLDRTETDAAS